MRFGVLLSSSLVKTLSSVFRWQRPSIGSLRANDIAVGVRKWFWSPSRNWRNDRRQHRVMKMASTNKFDEWLLANKPETQQDREELIRSVRELVSAGKYSTTEESGRLYVKTRGRDDILMLTSQKARIAFVIRVEDIDVPADALEGRFQTDIKPKCIK